MSRAESGDATEVLVRVGGWTVGDEVTMWYALPATHEGGDMYRLAAPADADDVEGWEFAPGEVVRCERRYVSDAQYNCWDGCLVAVARVG